MAVVARVTTRPAPPLLAWVERTLGGAACVVACRRLTGGVASVVHAVTAVRHGVRRVYVLRTWGREPPPWAASAVAAEVAILETLAASALPAPRVIGASTDADGAGLAVLMERLAGRVLLVPRDRERWLGEMASTLVRIHALALARGARVPAFESWLDRDRLAPPPDAARPALWRAAHALVAARVPAPTHAPRFIHRDYQHFNLLWSRNRLTGVVDWGSACLGPPDVDVGHCRLNLALLVSVDVADRFRNLYEAEAGRRVEARWDVEEILAYGAEWKEFLPHQVGDRAPLDVAGMTGRAEELLARALRRA